MSSFIYTKDKKVRVKSLSLALTQLHDTFKGGMTEEAVYSLSIKLSDALAYSISNDWALQGQEPCLTVFVFTDHNLSI